MKNFEDSLENKIKQIENTPKKPISLSEILKPIDDWTYEPKPPKTDEEIRMALECGWEETQRFVTYKIENYFELPRGDYILEGELIIPSHAKLKLNPGTNIYLDKMGQIISYGILEAIGIEKQPISFLNNFSNNSTLSGTLKSFIDKNWNNICFFGQHSENSSLEHCIIQGGHGISKSDYSYDSKENFSGFIKGRNCGGGVLLVDTKIEIKNCTFKENKVQDGEGGAIYVADSKLNLINSKIINNNGDFSIIYGKNSKLIISDCVMNNNSIQQIFYNSSVIKLENCEAHIHSCQIKNNLMGGTNSIDSKTHLKDTKIYSNASVNEGVAIRSENSEICIENSSIKFNEIFSRKEYYQKYPKIEEYYQNQLYQYYKNQGKKYHYNSLYETLWRGPTIFEKIYKKIFITKHGNDILRMSFANIINIFNKRYKNKYLCQRTSLLSTSLEDSHKSKIIAPGGGIYIENSNMSLNNCEIIGNKAKGGAGIYIQDSSFKINDSYISENKIKNSDIEGCVGKSQTNVNVAGGGIYIQNSEGKLYSSEITKNKADEGGGIYIKNYEIKYEGGKKKKVITKEVIIHDSNKIKDNIPDNIIEN